MSFCESSFYRFINKCYRMRVSCVKCGSCQCVCVCFMSQWFRAKERRETVIINKAHTNRHKYKKQTEKKTNRKQIKTNSDEEPTGEPSDTVSTFLN